MDKRKNIPDVSREIPIYPGLVYRLPPKPVELSMSEVPRSLLDFNSEINMDFEENSPFQEDVIQKCIKGQISHTFKNHKNWIV